MKTEKEISPIMARLSTYMSAAAGLELPASVVKDTKHHILDTVAAMVSGAQLTPACTHFVLPGPMAGKRSQPSWPRIC